MGLAPNSSTRFATRTYANSSVVCGLRSGRYLFILHLFQLRLGHKFAALKLAGSSINPGDLGDVVFGGNPEFLEAPGLHEDALLKRSGGFVIELNRPIQMGSESGKVIGQLEKSPTDSGDQDCYINVLVLLI